MSSPPYGLGYICLPDDYERSRQDPSTVRCLTRGDSMGLMVVIEASLLSLLAVIFVGGLILCKIIWQFMNFPQRERLRIFRQPMDLLMFSLIFADAIQGIGGALNLKWLRDGKLEEGTFCTVQGIIGNVGEVGVALSTLAITVYTVLEVFTANIVPSTTRTLGVLFVMWTFILVIVAIPNVIYHNHSYQTPVPYWCWIGKSYLPWRLLGEYVWLWAALFFSIPTYIALFLWMRGNLVLGEQTLWRFYFRRVRELREADQATLGRRRQSFAMLAYPFVYSILIIPLSIIRWWGFAEEAKSGVNSTAAQHNLAALAVFGLSGFLNVILLLTTRPRLGLFNILMRIREGPLANPRQDNPEAARPP